MPFDQVTFVLALQVESPVTGNSNFTPLLTRISIPSV